MEKVFNAILSALFALVIVARKETRHKPRPVTVGYIAGQIHFAELVDSGYLRQEWESESIRNASFILHHRTDSLYPEDSLFIFLDKTKHFITKALEAAVESGFFKPSKKPYYTTFRLNGQGFEKYKSQIIKDVLHE